MSIPRDVEMLMPWRILHDTSEIKNRAEQLSARLQSDLPPNHVLNGLGARAIATRVDCDDVLFETESAEMPLAVVHMTWRKETDTSWPRTKLFRNWQEWVRDEMVPAHDDYAGGETK
jgi:hypothetical protein